MAKRESIWTPANIVTVLRICGVPVFIIAILAPWPAVFGIDPFFEHIKPWIAAAIFSILAATDGVDGYLARSRNEVTTFGKFIDPIADKILTASALIALVELQVLPSWIVIVILCREFIVSGLRMIAASQGTVIAASWYGKAKTVFQIIAIILFIVIDSLIQNLPATMHDFIFWFSWSIMIIALILTIVSMVDYLAKAMPLLGFGPHGEALEDDAEESDTTAMTPSDALEAHDSSLGGTSALSEEVRALVSPEALSELASEVLSLAKERGAHIATAESLTGGLISGELTAISGSSEVLCAGFVTYTNAMKHHVLGVDEQVLETEGAVSEAVAVQMAQGAVSHSAAEYSVSVTGIAGPTGAEPGKPVGTVWMAVCCPSGCSAHRFVFSGNREEVRLQTVRSALLALRDALSCS